MTRTGQGRSDAWLAAAAPPGWSVTPAERLVPIGDHGHPGGGDAAFTIGVPASAERGTYHVTVEAAAGDAKAFETVAGHRRDTQVVTLIGADGSERTRTLDVSSDTWTTLAVALSGCVRRHRWS